MRLARVRDAGDRITPAEGVLSMWILFARAAKPDAAYWPGRRWLAVADAVAWPALWIAAVANARFNTGIVGVVVMAVATMSIVRRAQRALWRNERYWFTTWRWGVPVATLASLAWTIKLVA